MRLSVTFDSYISHTPNIKILSLKKNYLIQHLFKMIANHNQQTQRIGNKILLMMNSLTIYVQPSNSTISFFGIHTITVHYSTKTAL